MWCLKADRRRALTAGAAPLYRIMFYNQTVDWAGACRIISAEVSAGLRLFFSLILISHWCPSPSLWPPYNPEVSPCFCTILISVFSIPCICVDVKSSANWSVSGFFTPVPERVKDDDDFWGSWRLSLLQRLKADASCAGKNMGNWSNLFSSSVNVHNSKFKNKRLETSCKHHESPVQSSCHSHHNQFLMQNSAVFFCFVLFVVFITAT